MRGLREGVCNGDTWANGSKCLSKSIGDNWRFRSRLDLYSISGVNLLCSSPLRFGRRLFHSFTPLPLAVIFKKIPDPVRSLHHSCGSTLIFLFWSRLLLELLLTPISPLSAAAPFSCGFFSCSCLVAAASSLDPALAPSLAPVLSAALAAL